MFGLANYLHKYSEIYADMLRPLSNLLKKDVDCCWRNTEHDAFQAVKESLVHAPILDLPDLDRSFSVVCDTSDFAIGSALLQTDIDGRNASLHSNLDSSKLLKRTIQFMTKIYLL